MGVGFFLSLWWLALEYHFCTALSTPAPKPIPITVISGFLGSGKTTLLQQLLENKDKIRIAVIVNDVASVNIDSKLVSEGKNSPDGIVQLQNGCVCCSLAQELLGSVSELVTLSDIRGEEDAFDHIVVELSGVADPKGVRAQFQEATFYNMPIMERVRLDTMVTVVDCSVFLQHLKSSKLASRQETPELFFREGEDIPDEPVVGEEWIEGMPPALMEALLGDGAATGSTRNTAEEDNAVAELLVSQTETADVVLLNKVDLVDDDDQLETIDQIVRSLNPRATVNRTVFGEIPMGQILAVAGGRGVAEAGVVDDHRDAILAAEKALVVDNGVSNGRADENFDCPDPACIDNSHSHTHDHSHGIDNSHSHDHNHDCTDPDCTDESHSHDHNHACEDPRCTHESHSHSHSHVDQLGIGSFVYRARKPFEPKRLLAFLRHLPISRGLPEKESHEPELQISEATQSALERVVRSKGFTWLADSHLAANYWSHSGSSFELQCLGRWWSTLPRPEWPPEAVSTILSDFDASDHDEEDPDVETVGDRRQEVVFIGPGLVDKQRQKDISDCLDLCLLDDAEWNTYRDRRNDEGFLHATFPNFSPAKMLTY